MTFELNNASSSSHMIRTGPIKTGQQRSYPLLINFAHRCCRHAQENNCLTGLRHGIRQCLMFNKQIFNNDPMFANHNKNILNRKKGAGYWLWKPFMLLQELYVAQDVIVFKLSGWKESLLTKRDTFIILDVDKPEYTTTPAALASFIVIKRSFTSLRFVSEWLTYTQDSRVITEDANVLGSRNYPGFRAHRHDQSILSLLAKKWKLTVYPDPSRYGEAKQRPYPNIFHHHLLNSSETL